MTQTPSYFVNSPVSGTTYRATTPAFEFIPNNGTSYTVTCRAWSGPNGTGSLVSVTSITAIDHNVTANTDPNSFTFNGGNAASASSSNGTNGSNVFCGGGRYTGGAIGSLEIYAVYTGQPVVNLWYGDPSGNGVVHSVVNVWYGDPSGNGAVHQLQGIWVPVGNPPTGVKRIW